MGKEWIFFFNVALFFPQGLEENLGVLKKNYTEDPVFKKKKILLKNSIRF